MVRGIGRLIAGTGVAGEVECIAFHLTRDERYFGYLRGRTQTQLPDTSRLWRTRGKKY